MTDLNDYVPLPDPSKAETTGELAAMARELIERAPAGFAENEELMGALAGIADILDLVPDFKLHEGDET